MELSPPRRLLAPLAALLLTAPAFAQNPPARPAPVRPAAVRPAAPAQPRPAARPAPHPAANPVVAHPAPAHPAPAQPVAPAQPAHPAANPSPLPTPNGPLSAMDVAQRVQGFYDRTTDFQADFVQLSHNRLYGDERRNGHVMFRKPGRMRWNYANNDLIVSDGTTLWAYQSDDRQAIQQNLGQSQLPTAIAFLAGTGRLTDSFTFTLLDPAQYRFPSGYVLQLRPTSPQPTYEQIVFYVDRASFQVVRTAVIDAQGNYNRFDFTAPQVNLDIPETTFRWSPPAGTSIVRP